MRLINIVKTILLPTWLIQIINPRAPKGIITDARKWIENLKSLSIYDFRYPPLGWYKDVDQSQIIVINPPPLHIGPKIEQNNSKTNSIFIENETALFMISNARICGTEGTVLSPDGKIFSEFTYKFKNGKKNSHPIFKRKSFPKIDKLKGMYLTIIYPSSFAYYHWVAESLSRLRFIDKNIINHLDGVFYPANAGQFARDSLKAIGFNESQLILLTKSTYYQCDKLMVPLFCPGLNMPAWVGNFLKQKFIINKQKSNSKPYRKIFISRNDAKGRKIRNEKELLPILKSYGFEIVHLSEMSFVDQANLFYQSKIIIGPHGAGLVNVFFCQPGVQIIELMPSKEVLPHLYYVITCQVGGHYFYTAGTPVKSHMREV